FLTDRRLTSESMRCWAKSQTLRTRRGERGCQMTCMPCFPLGFCSGGNFMLPGGGFLPLSPRDLAPPGAGGAGKGREWERLRESAATLRELAGLAKVTQGQWPDTEAVRRLRAVPSAASETTAERLQRGTARSRPSCQLCSRP